MVTYWDWQVFQVFLPYQHRPLEPIFPFQAKNTLENCHFAEVTI